MTLQRTLQIKNCSQHIYKYYTTHILPPANFESSSNIAQVKTPYIHIYSYHHLKETQKWPTFLSLEKPIL